MASAVLSVVTDSPPETGESTPQGGERVDKTLCALCDLRVQKTLLSHTEYAENAELPVLSTWFTLALEYAELHQLHGAPCGV